MRRRAVADASERPRGWCDFHEKEKTSNAAHQSHAGGPQRVSEIVIGHAGQGQSSTVSAKKEESRQKQIGEVEVLITAFDVANACAAIPTMSREGIPKGCWGVVPSRGPPEGSLFS